MMHKMNLWEDAFEKIKEKTKSIEMRLNDKKRSYIKIDDIIEIVNSDFIILDEPTLGLDISSIIFLKETLLNLKKEGKTILITSHNTKFCEDLADNIYLIFNKNIKRLDYINGCSLEQLFITEIGG